MRLASPAVCLVLLVFTAIAALGTGSALAGPALDDDKVKKPATATDEPDCGSTPSDPRCPQAAAPDTTEVEYGVGVRLRSVWVPKALLELFVERSAGGAHNYGFGVDLSRRRGTTELQLGFEYERINVGQ